MLCISAVCSDGCGNNGECTSPGMCTCSPGYTGAFCRTPVCSDGCGNSQCTSPGRCTCSPGYTGASCKTFSGCPSSHGFFVAPGTTQCMKAFLEEHSWDSAESLCRSEKLRLAKPEDALALNKYLKDKYGSKRYWLSARGTGSGGWQWADGEALSRNNPLWANGEPESTSRSQCLRMDAYYQDVASGRPYYTYTCSNRYTPLCEAVCSPGYIGASCRTPVCSDGCGNGQCTSPDRCTCSSGYTGASCKTSVCSDDCG
ncbi:unnamed protein product, partial [Meganyctiphanes norvegica]